MNGGGNLYPVHLKVYNDTEEGYNPVFITAFDAKVEVINPATIKARIEKLKNTIKDTLYDNYITPLYRIDMEEDGKRNEDKAFVLDNTDATAAISSLCTEARKVPKMMGDAIDPFYDEAVAVCNRYQAKFNRDAWDTAESIKRNMGENARIQEIFVGGNN